jgi:deoxyribonuclease-4
LIENTAGMGTAVGSRLEEVAQIVRGLRDLDAGACLDTAHLFAAGYDIRSEAGLENTIGQIERTIGLENVPVFHVNDSKIPLGGRVDRHEHIGKGKIGEAAFARILQHPRFGAAEPEGLAGRAFLLETPIDDPGDDRRNVAKIWELAGLQGPVAEKGFSMLTPAMRKMKKELEKKGKRFASSRDLPARKGVAKRKKAKRKTKKDV